MKKITKSLIASATLAAIVAVSGLTQPAAADSPVFPGIIVDANPTPIGPQIPPRLRLPTEQPNIITYPSCPNGFELKQRGAHIFRCTRDVSNALAQIAIQNANGTSCAPESYWNVGPEVSSQPSTMNKTLVTFRCRHL